MATIKSYTDLEQSKKLAEILPLESADMYFTGHKSITNPKEWEYRDTPEVRGKYIDFDDKRIFYPCWSLATLLGVLPTLDGRNAVLCKDIRYDEWHICYHSTATLSVIDTEKYNNPVDACYEMIIRLHEQNLL